MELQHRILTINKCFSIMLLTYLLLRGILICHKFAENAFLSEADNFLFGAESFRHLGLRQPIVL